MSKLTRYEKYKAVGLERNIECQWFKDWFRSTRLEYAELANVFGVSTGHLGNRLNHWCRPVVPPELAEWVARYEAFLNSQRLRAQRARVDLMVANCNQRMPDIPDCLKERKARTPLTAAESEQCRRFAAWVRETRMQWNTLCRVLDVSRDRLRNYFYGRSRLRDRDIAEWLANYDRFLAERWAGLAGLRERIPNESSAPG